MAGFGWRFGPLPRGAVAADRQDDGEGAADAFLAGDRQPAQMAGDDVLDDGEAQAGTAEGAAARLVHAVEPLGQARQVLLGDTLPLVDDGDGNLALALARRATTRTWLAS